MYILFTFVLEVFQRDCCDELKDEQYMVVPTFKMSLCMGWADLGRNASGIWLGSN